MDIRKDTNKPVVVKKELDLKTSLTKDLYNLTNEYNKVAIITKDEKEALKLYNLLENTIDISLVELDTKKYNKNLIIIPAYSRASFNKKTINPVVPQILE